MRSHVALQLLFASKMSHQSNFDQQRRTASIPRQMCLTGAIDPGAGAGVDVEQERPTMEPKPSVVAPRKEGVARRAVVSPALSNLGQRLCWHCGTAKTLQWREGPEGRKMLCNACGVRYRTDRLVPEHRPLRSPTLC
ncbi:GATA transcription factor 11 [Hordeum vulgare]|nr:GATA transcription factor 11 [Hordeum vulgare]